MKISYNWLADYVAVEQSPEALSEMLTMAGLEVDEVRHTGPELEGVIVGEVLSVRPHPNADRLSICMVDVGATDPSQIICGAPNVASGRRVPVATLGTTLHLPDPEKPGERVPVTIKKARIRGERSAGMICAEDELGLSDDHSGIMVLDPSAPIGKPLAAILEEQNGGLFDAVIDIDITPNRQDAISHIGVARDVAAVSGNALEIPEVDIPAVGGGIDREAKVEIRSPEGCGRYAAILIREVTIAESPAWLKHRLETVGLRPINNVVDITNYVMYECGQPLHAFDFDLLAEGTVVVEATATPTTFTTLDDQERKLPAGTLMICDARGPIAVAGVMGGENSEVSETTTNVLIESAYFDPASIRRTSKHLGLQTDASYRFERGVDPENTAWAATRAANLLCALTGGRRIDGLIDERAMPPFSREVPLRLDRITSVLGTEVSSSEVERLLSAIGFVLRPETPGNRWICEVPPFRRDVEREVDLIEEVARLFGYDNIPEPQRGTISYDVPRREAMEVQREKTIGLLSGLGFREIYTNSLLSDEWARRFSLSGPEAVVGTVNSVSRDMTTLRPALLPGALHVVAHNQKHGRRSIRFAEFGHVFEKSDARDAVVPGYAEREHLLILLSGALTPPTFDGEDRHADVYDMKGSVETLCRHLGLGTLSFETCSGIPETEYAMEMHIDGKGMGVIGKLASQIEDELDLRYPVFYAEIDWEMMAAAAEATDIVRYEPISRFPVVERDLALVVPESTPAGELVAEITRVGGKLLRETDVFDIYEGDQVPPGKKSMAFTLRFGASRTLVDKEVDAQIERILQKLQKSYGATLR